MSLPPPNYTWQQFEIDAAKFHQDTTNQKTYLWVNIPEDILYNCGYITNFSQTRLKRLERYKDKDNNPLKDYGVDAIAIEIKPDESIIYHPLQMKYYPSSAQIKASDLGSFSFVYHERIHKQCKDSKGYIYYYGKLEVNLSEDLPKSDHFITIKYQFPSITMEINELTEKNFPMYQHQIDCLDTLMNPWDGLGMINLPCGVGKTRILNEYASQKYKKVIYLSPFKIHAQQNLDRIIPFLPNAHYLLVDSDTNGTRDEEEILKVMNEDSWILSSTYKSGEDVLLSCVKKILGIPNKKKGKKKAIFIEKKVIRKFTDEEIDEIIDELTDEEIDELLTPKINTNPIPTIRTNKKILSDILLIVDEVHNLVDNENLFNLCSYFTQVLGASATPIEYLDMKRSFNCLFKFPMKDAIAKGIICDYRIFLPLLSDKNEIPKDLSNIKNEDHQYILQCLFLLDGMLHEGSRRCIIYCSSKEECQKILKLLELICSCYHGLDFCGKRVNDDVDNKTRTDILTEFQADNKENEDVFRFITSVRILDESIDIVRCDSVFIMNVSEYSSKIKMIQRMCRANRKDKTNPNKVANIFLWADDQNNLVGFLNELRVCDDECYKKLSHLGVGNYDKQKEKKIIEKVEAKRKEFQEFYKVKSMSYDEILKLRILNYYKWYCVHGRHAKYKSNPLNEEQEIEKEWSIRWMRIKEAKKGIGKSKLPIHLEELIINYFGVDWYKNRDLISEALNKYKNYIKWMLTENNNEHAKKIIDKKTEMKWYRYWNGIKLAKRSKGSSKLYYEVEKMIIEHFGEDWYYIIYNDKEAMDTFNEFLIWKNNKGNFPESYPKAQTDKEKEENRWYRYWECLKQSKRGTCHHVVYPEVETLIIKLFGEKWYLTKKKKKELEIKILEDKFDDFIKLHDKYEFKKNWTDYWKKLKQLKREDKLSSTISDKITEIFGPTWYHKKDFEKEANERFADFILWKETINGNKHARYLDYEPKNDKEKLEKRWYNYWSDLKKAKRENKKNIIHDSLEIKIIEKFGTNWYMATDYKTHALNRFNDFLKWKELNGNRKVRDMNNFSTPKEEEEYRWYAYWRTIKNAKNGIGSNILYEELEKIIVEKFGPKWLENNDI